MFMLLGPYERLSTYVTDPAQLKGGDVDRLIQKYGLDDPWYQQYGRWLNGILHGDFGWSESAGAPVTKAILDRLPATLELAFLAVLPIIFGGIMLGVIAAVNHNKFADHIIRLFAIIGWSFPDYVLGLFILMIFYGILGWFPPGRLDTWAMTLINSPEFIRYTGFNILDGLLNGNVSIIWDALRHLIAPVITLSILWSAFLLRITRSSMLETLRKDYIRTARAKGVEERVVINKHAKRNALIPVITVAGPLAFGLVQGVVIVETIYGYRGMGQFAAQAAAQLDYSGILGFVIFISSLLIITNLIVDVSYAIIDPRIRLE
jgi:ABC-type dipeptide/oligopeptide/nickel transport system permease component